MKYKYLFIGGVAQKQHPNHETLKDKINNIVPAFRRVFVEGKKSVLFGYKTKVERDIEALQEQLAANEVEQLKQKEESNNNGE